jgi:predicted nucleic acid-binding protein
MVKVLFDTNILIDKTLNIEQAEIELASYDDAAISAITWMESTVKLDDKAIAEFDRRLALSGIKVIHTRRHHAARLKAACNLGHQAARLHHTRDGVE